MTPDDLTALGVALYGKRWRGAMARALGCDWDRIEAWRTGRNKPSRRYREKLWALRLERDLRFFDEVVAEVMADYA